MKNTLLILSFTSLLISCASTNMKQEKQEYLDLTNDHDNSIFDTYWKINKRVTPKYPMKAAMGKISGCVELLISINEKGEVEEYKINKSYPKRLFDENAQTSLTTWKYNPTKENTTNQPVLTLVQLDFMFSPTEIDPLFEKHCINEVSGDSL